VRNGESSGMNGMGHIALGSACEKSVYRPQDKSSSRHSLIFSTVGSMTNIHYWKIIQ
jgi:hypothetical protein